MLKGINKNVIEVMDIENEHFERVILFLKPENPESDEKTIRQWAGEYMRSIQYRPRKVRSPWRIAFKLLQLGSAVGVGVFLANLF